MHQEERLPEQAGKRIDKGCGQSSGSAPVALTVYLQRTQNTFNYCRGIMTIKSTVSDGFKCEFTEYLQIIGIKLHEMYLLFTFRV